MEVLDAALKQGRLHLLALLVCWRIPSFWHFSQGRSAILIWAPYVKFSFNITDTGIQIEFRSVSYAESCILVHLIALLKLSWCGLWSVAIRCVQTTFGKSLYNKPRALRVSLTCEFQVTSHGTMIPCIPVLCPTSYLWYTFRGEPREHRASGLTNQRLSHISCFSSYNILCPPCSCWS